MKNELLTTINEPQRKQSLPVQDLIQTKREEWDLRVFSPEGPARQSVTSPDLHRPGLAFAGFTEVFSWERIQIIGEIEWAYLNSMSGSARKKIADAFYSFALPCVFLSKSQKLHPEFLQGALHAGIPLVGTSMTTMEIMNALHLYLKDYFSPETSLHASLVDVYGVGMLYTGKPGIGKSECCLDLVERGHRLVADDVVRIVRNETTLTGSSNALLGHHMEIRGLGIIDVQSLFGIRAIRQEKKIDMVVELVEWTLDIDYERIGIEDFTTDVLGVPVPKVAIPISPGKNITVISEVVAMNMLLRMSGINSARQFNNRLIQSMKKMKGER